MEAPMGKKSSKKTEYVLFNVTYEDGSQRSNRRVPLEALDGLEKDLPARKIIEEQDREVAEKSGKPVLAIKTIVRA
jgi:hypothetical protein